MKRHHILLLTPLCLAAAVQAVASGPLSSEQSLWRETQGLDQLEARWALLQGFGPGSAAAWPVTCDGPIDTRSAHGGGTPADGPFRPSLRFDLHSAMLFQSGQASDHFLSGSFGFGQDLRDPDLRTRVGTGLLVRLSPRWSFRQRVMIDSEPGRDPASRTKEFHQINSSVEIPEAALVYESGEMAAWLGRRWERWGPGWTGSLILEPGGPPADGFGGSWSRSRWSLRYRCGRLDDHFVDDQPVSRYLAGHRLDYSVTPAVRIGLSETALTSSHGALPLWLLNPILPWSMAQSEARGPAEGTNILWALDGIWNPTASWALYGQFLLDDYMIDGPDRDIHPDQLGFLAGVLWTGGTAAESPGVWRIGLEYSRLGSWTYVHREPELRYRSWGTSLGHASGPDSETATLICSRSGLARSATAQIWTRWHRQGQVWLDTPLGPVGSAGYPWPTRPVNRWLQAGAALRARLVLGSTATLRAGWTDPAIADLPAGQEANPAFATASRGWWGSLTIALPLFRFEPGL